MSIVYVAVFGVLGVFARYFTNELAQRFLPPNFPYATFTINVFGAFLIGATYVAGFERTQLSAELRTGIMIGFLGGFTTFSSYCLEGLRLLQGEHALLGLAYLGFSPVFGVLATAAGMQLARSLFGA